MVKLKESNIVHIYNTDKAIYNEPIFVNTLDKSFYNFNNVTWHPESEDIAFFPNHVGARNLGVNLTSVVAIDTIVCENLGSFPHFSQNGFGVFAWKDKPFLAVCDGVSPGSMTLIAKSDVQIPYF